MQNIVSKTEPISIDRSNKPAHTAKPKRGRPRKAPTQEQIDALRHSTNMMRKFARAHAKHEEAVKATIEDLDEFWSENLRDDYLPSDRQWRAYLRNYTPQEIIEAVAIAASSYHSGGCGSGSHSITPTVKYIWAVLKNRREQQQDKFATE